MADNPTPTPGEVTAGLGEPDQLGYGEATAANEEIAFGDQVEEQIADQSLLDTQGMGPQPDTDVVYADDDEPDFAPSNEDEEILFGPAEGVSSPIVSGKPIPNSILRSLPLLSQIANDPTTPASIRAAYKFILARIEAEQEDNF